MRQLIRKGSFQLNLSYNNRGFATLFGANFQVETSDEIVYLMIGLEGNLRAKDRDSDCIHDTHELVEISPLLEGIQVNEDQIIKTLLRLFEKHPTADWHMELCIGELGTLKYKAIPKVEDLDLYFLVSNLVEQQEVQCKV